jgi:hypothetical protein
MFGVGGGWGVEGAENSRSEYMQIIFNKIGNVCMT